MTVKCLNGVEKAAVQYRFQHLNTSITTLSYEFKVSRRTIIRVLEEGGLDPKIHRRGKATPQITSQPLVIKPTAWHQKAWQFLNKPVPLPSFMTR